MVLLCIVSMCSTGTSSVDESTSSAIGDDVESIDPRQAMRRRNSTTAGVLAPLLAGAVGGENSDNGITHEQRLVELCVYLFS